MILIHENVAANAATKPMGCPTCGYKRAFDVPLTASVRKAKRVALPQDAVLLKCKKCGVKVGVSTENNN